MESKHKFFVCKHCGNLVGLILNRGVPLICCGEKMTELIPNTVEASVEKHLPVIERQADKVTVSIGSQPHPMTQEHHITFVFLETVNGGQKKTLKIGQEPKLDFVLVDDEPVAVYAFCNLHGLWKTTI